MVVGFQAFPTVVNVLSFFLGIWREHFGLGNLMFQAMKLSEGTNQHYYIMILLLLESKADGLILSIVNKNISTMLTLLKQLTLKVLHNNQD